MGFPECAGYGLKSAISGHQLVTTLSISLVWIIYSAIPPLLLVAYRFCGRGSFLSWLCWLCFLVSSACGFLAILILWNVYPAEVWPAGCLKGPSIKFSNYHTICCERRRLLILTVL